MLVGLFVILSVKLKYTFILIVFYLDTRFASLFEAVFNYITFLKWSFRETNQILILQIKKISVDRKMTVAVPHCWCIDTQYHSVWSTYWQGKVWSFFGLDQNSFSQGQTVFNSSINVSSLSLGQLLWCEDHKGTNDPVEHRPPWRRLNVMFVWMLRAASVEGVHSVDSFWTLS